MYVLCSTRLSCPLTAVERQLWRVLICLQTCSAETLQIREISWKREKSAADRLSLSGQFSLWREEATDISSYRCLCPSLSYRNSLVSSYSCVNYNRTLKTVSSSVLSTASDRWTLLMSLLCEGDLSSPSSLNVAINFALIYCCHVSPLVVFCSRLVVSADNSLQMWAPALDLVLPHQFISPSVCVSATLSLPTCLHYRH